MGKTDLEPPIKDGYVLRARKLLKSEASGLSPAIREIWDWLILNANHKDMKEFKIKRGQLYASHQDIRDGLKWRIGYRFKRYSEDVTKKAMTALRERQMIATRRTVRGTLITICNYSFYQDKNNYRGTPASTTVGTIGGTEVARRSHDHNTIMFKNDKECKEVEGEIYPYVDDENNDSSNLPKTDFVPHERHSEKMKMVGLVWEEWARLCSDIQRPTSVSMGPDERTAAEAVVEMSGLNFEEIAGKLVEYVNWKTKQGKYLAFKWLPSKYNDITPGESPGEKKYDWIEKRKKEMDEAKK